MRAHVPPLTVKTAKEMMMLILLGSAGGVMTKKRRKPRQPTEMAVTTVSFDDAMDAEIIAGVEHWYSLLAAILSSEAGQLAVQGDIDRQLRAGDAAKLPLDHIVAMGDGGHAPADHALRQFIHEYIDADRFADLPLQLRGYGQRSLLRPPAAGYPSTVSQVANDLTRDIAIGVLVDQIVLRWPTTPKLYSSARHRSAAAYVALVFTRHGNKLAEQTVRRIYGARNTLSRRLAEFLLAHL